MTTAQAMAWINGADRDICDEPEDLPDTDLAPPDPVVVEEIGGEG